MIKKLTRILWLILQNEYQAISKQIPIYKPGTPTPVHFQPPKVDIEPITRSYLYFTSRTDGKEVTKCEVPHFNIKNRSDLKFLDGNMIHMSKPTQIEFSVNDPKSAFMKYTIDGTIPSLINGKDIREGETLEIITSCAVRVIAFMHGYLESEMLEKNFIIESEEGIDPRFQKAIKLENADMAERPEHYVGPVENVIETLDTPTAGYLMRTPSYTPMLTPLTREPSNSRDYHDDNR